MSTPSEGSVDIDAIWLDRQGVDRLLQHDGDMTESLFHGYSEKSRKLSD